MKYLLNLVCVAANAVCAVFAFERGWTLVGCFNALFCVANFLLVALVLVFASEAEKLFDDIGLT